MKSIITFVLLLPFVLTIKLQENEFTFVDEAPSQLSSVLSDDYSSQQLTDDDEPIEYSKNWMPKKFNKVRIIYLIHFNNFFKSLFEFIIYFDDECS